MAKLNECFKIKIFGNFHISNGREDKVDNPKAWPD